MGQGEIDGTVLRWWPGATVQNSARHKPLYQTKNSNAKGECDLPSELTSDKVKDNCLCEIVNVVKVPISQAPKAILQYCNVLHLPQVYKEKFHFARWRHARKFTFISWEISWIFPPNFILFLFTKIQQQIHRVQIEIQIPFFQNKNKCVLSALFYFFILRIFCTVYAFTLNIASLSITKIFCEDIESFKQIHFIKKIND